MPKTDHMRIYLPLRPFLGVASINAVSFQYKHN